jgi:predicted nucleic acid-binding protein
VRVILDTNVFVSGVFFSGPPYQILEAWKDDRFHLIISQDILAEYSRVAEILSSQFPAI